MHEFEILEAGDSFDLSEDSFDRSSVVGLAADYDMAEELRPELIYSETHTPEVLIRHI